MRECAREETVSGQFRLMGERRFAPFFWTQFLGAANDNLLKFAFTLLVTYHAAEWGGADPSTVGFLLGALFITPFLLLSATAGQLADKLDKARLMRRVKELEIARSEEHTSELQSPVHLVCR